MTPHIGMYWGGFHHRVAYRMTGRQQMRGVGVRWAYTLLAEALMEAGLKEVEIYVSRCQNTPVQFIATSTLWTCAWQWIGARGHGYTSGGGSSKAWTWRGCGWRLRRMDMRSARKIRMERIRRQRRRRRQRQIRTTN